MSHICFQDMHGEAEVGGRERHYLAGLVQHVAESVFCPERFVRYSSPEDAAALADIFGEANPACLEFLFGMYRDSVRVAGQTWRPFDLVLNTAMAIGNDALHFATRVHAQCEIHGYVEGPNRAWLAGIVDEGMRIGILRKESQGYGEGWADVAKLLRARDDCPVVMSYSITDGFPNQSVASWGDDSDESTDAWYDLPAEEQWRLCMDGLRSRPTDRLEMRPGDAWAELRFGDGRTMWDVEAAVLAALDARRTP